jgi:hypothetical protein
MTRSWFCAKTGQCSLFLNGRDTGAKMKPIIWRQVRAAQTDAKAIACALNKVRAIIQKGQELPPCQS